MAARFETIEIAAPLAEPLQWATGTALERRTRLVRATTESGVDGWAELLRGDIAGAMEIASFDAAARESGVPLAKLLSERAASDVDVYASGIYYGGVDPAEEASGYLREGFTSVKMKIGRLSIADDLARVRAVRAAIGDAPLMADANGAYGIELALAMAPALRELGVLWLEEPFPLDDLDAYRALRKRRIVDVAAGESLERGSLEHLIDFVDVIQPNVATCGGVTATVAILSRAAARGVRPAIHAWGTPIMTAVSLHVAAACAQFGIRPIVEIDRTPNPLRAIAREFEVHNGVVALPPRPSLGVDESAIAAFRVRGAA